MNSTTCQISGQRALPPCKVAVYAVCLIRFCLAADYLHWNGRKQGRRGVHEKRNMAATTGKIQGRDMGRGMGVGGREAGVRNRNYANSRPLPPARAENRPSPDQNRPEQASSLRLANSLPVGCAYSGLPPLPRASWSLLLLDVGALCWLVRIPVPRA